jgi:predicted HicB family RNase H-like nuclease
MLSNEFWREIKALFIELGAEIGEIRGFLERYTEDGVEPRKPYSGTFNGRVPPDLHAGLAITVTAEDKRLNHWIADVLKQAVHD